MPKSVSLTSPRHDSSTLPGEMSRWTMPSARPLHVERVVRVVERVEHVARDQRRELGRQPDLRARALAEQREHVEAVDVLHRDVRRVGIGAELEHLDDVAVIELRGDPRLVDEHLDERLVGREVRQDLLDRDQLLEAVLARSASP